MIKRLDHVGIVVDNLSEAQSFLESLGLKRVRDLRIPGRLNASFYSCGEVDIEIMEISNEDERARRLRGEAARIEHVAIEVDSLSTTVQALNGLGVRMQTSDPVTLDKGTNYWTVEDTTDGVVYQLIELDQMHRQT